MGARRLARVRGRRRGGDADNVTMSARSIAAGARERRVGGDDGERAGTAGRWQRRGRRMSEVGDARGRRRVGKRMRGGERRIRCLGCRLSVLNKIARFFYSPYLLHNQSQPLHFSRSIGSQSFAEKKKTIQEGRSIRPIHCQSPMESFRIDAVPVISKIRGKG